MGHQAGWIGFWVTLACWLGSVWGCAPTTNTDPGQAILEEQPHQGPPAPHHEMQETAGAATTKEAEQRTVHATPSIRTLDRSKWPRIKVGPVDGSAPHGLLLFKDLPADLGNPQPEVPQDAQLDLEVVMLPAEDFSRVNENTSVNQAQLLDALSDAQAQNWSAQNGTHLVLQPLKVSLDLLAAPLLQINGSDQPDAVADLLLTPDQVFKDLFHSEPQETTTAQPPLRPIDTPSVDTPPDTTQQDSPPPAEK